MNFLIKILSFFTFGKSAEDILFPRHLPKQTQPTINSDPIEEPLDEKTRSIIKSHAGSLNELYVKTSQIKEMLRHILNLKIFYSDTGHPFITTLYKTLLFTFTIFDLYSKAVNRISTGIFKFNIKEIEQINEALMSIKKTIRIPMAHINNLEQKEGNIK